MVKKFVRRQYLIDRSFQGRFILKFCAVVIMSSLIIAGLLFFLLRDSTTVAIENTKVLVKSTSDFILPVVLIVLLIVFVFSATLVMIMTLLMSHKISGPLFRLKREIEGLKDGDFNRDFRIRANDQLQELSKSLSEMCSSLKEKQVDLREKTKLLKAYLEKKSFYIRSEEKEEFMKLLNDLEKIINYFKI